MDNSILWLVVCLYQVVDFELHYAIRVERGSARVKCLNQEHMIIRNPNQDTKPRPLDPESSMPTIRPLCLPGKLCLLMFVVYIYSLHTALIFIPARWLSLVGWKPLLDATPTSLRCGQPDSKNWWHNLNCLVQNDNVCFIVCTFNSFNVNSCL